MLLLYTLKNKAASGCIDYKNLLISEESLFNKRLFVVKEGSSDVKKVRKRCFLTELFFYGIAVKKLVCDCVL